MKKLLPILFVLALLIAPTNADAGRRGGIAKSTQASFVGLNYSALEQGNGNTPNVDYPTGSLSDYQFFRTKNINRIRLPIKWERIQPSVNGALDSTYLGFITQNAAWAESLGMKITLDLHNYGGRGNNKLGDGTLTYANYADLWTKLATALKDNTTIDIYDIMNEPSNMPGVLSPPLTPAENWAVAAQNAISAIRLVDQTKYIMVEGNGYSSAFQWLESGNDILKNLNDPYGRLIYSAHFYHDRNNSGSHFIWAEEVAAGDELTNPVSVLNTNIGVKRATVFVNWCKENGFVCNIGESGVGQNDPNWLASLDNAIQYLLDNEVTIYYWAAGPYFATYPYGVQPQSGTIKDTVQWAVLTKYTEAPQPTKFYLSGPTSGTTGVPSSPFTITYRGYHTSDLHFTPTDGSAGGTFTPSSLTIPAGFNGTATFTYTPPGDQVYSISATNTEGLVIDAAQGFATVQDFFQQYSLTPQNVFAPIKLVSAYNGPLYRLRRANDNAEQDFGATSIQLNAPLDENAIATWATAASGTATISGTTMTVSPGNTGVYAVGQFLRGTGVADLTQITALGTGTGGPGTYTVSPAVGQGSITGTTLTLTSVSVGAFQPGQTITGTGVTPGTIITGLTSGSGGPGSYTVNNSQSVSSTAISVSQNVASTNILGLNGTFIVKQYDQSPNNYYAGPPHSIDGSGDGPPATLADQPRFLLNCVNGKPCTRWVTNRMDARAPLNGKTQISLFSAIRPAARDAGRLWAWDLVQNHAFPGTGLFQLSGTGQPTMLLNPGNWGSYFGRWQANVSKGQTSYRNGAIAQQTDTIGQSALVFQFRDVAKRGYFVFAPSYFVGDEYMSVITQEAASDSAIAAMDTIIRNQIATPSTPTPPVFPPQPPPDPDAPSAYPLTGVNLAGMEFGGQAFYPTAAEAAYYYSRGMRIVRLPVHWERLQPTLGTALDSGELGRLTTVVNNMRAAGLVSLIDLHNYGAYNGQPINGVGGPTYAQFADFWSRMATAFSANPKVDFDLMNEPSNVNAATMGTASQAAITAIRGAGFTGYIHVEGGGSYAACQSFEGSGAGAAYLALSDPLSKMMAHCHAYLDIDNSGTHDEAAPPGIGLTKLASVTAYARANGIKLFLGEFGIANTTSMYVENAAMLDFIAANDDVWNGWTAWGGGPAWGESYIYKLDPAGMTPTIVDKPQVPLLYQKRNL